MLRPSHHIVAWALIGLHLADALLVSGGRWLASYAHQHSATCAAHCQHAAKATCSVKKRCCGHHHHASADLVKANDTARPFIQAGAPRDGFCDDCAACRHERQSLLAVRVIPGMAVQPLVLAAETVSHATPSLRLMRAFDGRGPPTVTS